MPEDLRRRALGLFLESKDAQEELLPCTNVEKPAVSLSLSQITFAAASRVRVASKCRTHSSHTPQRVAAAAAKGIGIPTCALLLAALPLAHSHLRSPSCALPLAHSRLRSPTCGTPTCALPLAHSHLRTPTCALPLAAAVRCEGIDRGVVASRCAVVGGLSRARRRAEGTVGLSHRQSHVRVCFDGFWPWPPTPPPPRMQSRARARARSRCCREITHVTARSQGQTQRRL